MIRKFLKKKDEIVMCFAYHGIMYSEGSSHTDYRLK